MICFEKTSIAPAGGGEMSMETCSPATSTFNSSVIVSNAGIEATGAMEIATTGNFRGNVYYFSSKNQSGEEIFMLIYQILGYKVNLFFNNAFI